MERELHEPTPESESNGQRVQNVPIQDTIFNETIWIEPLGLGIHLRIMQYSPGKEVTTRAENRSTNRVHTMHSRKGVNDVYRRNMIAHLQ